MTKHSRAEAPRPRGLTHPGQSLVEFAFVLPVLLLLTMGTIDLGRAIVVYNQLSTVARDSARAGVVNSTTTSLRSMCQQVFPEMQAWLPAGTTWTCPSSGASSPATVTAGPLTATFSAGTAGDPNNPNQITLTYIFTPITPLIDQAAGIANGRSIQLQASSRMYVES